MIENDQLGTAVAAYLAANPQRDILVWKAPDGPGQDIEAGTYYMDVRDDQIAPTDEDLETAFDLAEAAQAPERGFDHADQTIPYTDADCLKVLEAERLVGDDDLFPAGSTIRIEFSNGTVFVGQAVAFTAMAAAFHAAVAAMMVSVP